MAERGQDGAGGVRGSSLRETLRLGIEIGACSEGEGEGEGEGGGGEGTRSPCKAAAPTLAACAGPAAEPPRTRGPAKRASPASTAATLSASRSPAIRKSPSPIPGWDAPAEAVSVDGEMERGSCVACLLSPPRPWALCPCPHQRPRLLLKRNQWMKRWSGVHA